MFHSFVGLTGANHACCGARRGNSLAVSSPVGDLRGIIRSRSFIAVGNPYGALAPAPRIRQVGSSITLGGGLSRSSPTSGLFRRAVVAELVVPLQVHRSR